MNKEKIIELFNQLSAEETFEVVKAIMPEFCRSMSKDAQRMKEMMKSMMSFMGKDMANWMGMMNFTRNTDK